MNVSVFAEVTFDKNPFKQFLLGIADTMVQQPLLYCAQDHTLEKGMQKAFVMETIMEAAVKLQDKTVHTVSREKGYGKDQCNEEGSMIPPAQKMRY